MNLTRANVGKVLSQVYGGFAMEWEFLTTGRVSRGEFWRQVLWSVLPVFILAIGCWGGWIAGVDPILLLTGAGLTVAWVLFGPVMLNLRGTFRRLHDAGHSGGWALFYVVFILVLLLSIRVGPVISEALGYFIGINGELPGEIVSGFAAVLLISPLLATLAITPLLVVLALPGTACPNQFGPAPGNSAARVPRIVRFWRWVNFRMA